MTDTRWEEAKQDLIKDHPRIEAEVDLILNGLKSLGWTICYPKDWPDLCGNCKSHIDQDTWHSVLNGNMYGACEIHEGPPRGMVPRNWADKDGNWPLVPYWGDPKPKKTE